MRRRRRRRRWRRARPGRRRRRRWGELAGRLDVEELRREALPEQSVLMTADGKSVKERRHTAWLADEGIGALAYSGKLMAPASLAGSPSVAALRDALERQSGERFDCVLCNYYPNGEAACGTPTPSTAPSGRGLPRSSASARPDVSPSGR